MDENAKKQIEDLVKRFEQIESSLNSAQKILRRLENDYLKVDYTQMEGKVGKFDGVNMVADNGKKYKVNENYAAKSKLVYGDVLKLIEEDGKELFKQIQKVDKTRVEGIMTKKDGEWYILTDRGSYKVSDAAAEYQNAELNSEASAFLPEDDLDAPFAALDTVEKPSVVEVKPGKEAKTTEKKTKEDTKKDSKKEEDLKDLKEKEVELKKEEKPKKRTTAKKKPKKTSKKSPRRTKSKPKSSVKSEQKEEKKSDRKKIIDDDDLI